MRYTDKPPVPEHYACSYMHTLNVFSVKLAGIDDSIRWPLHVFGIVAVRDSLDHNRNVIFLRGRDNCQIVHQKVGNYVSSASSANLDMMEWLS